MRYCGIAVFGEFFCGIAVFRTPQCPPLIVITKNNLVILTEPILNFEQDLAQRGKKGVDSMVILWFPWRTSSTSVLVFPD